MSASNGHEFLKKPSPFSDENALAHRFFGHDGGNRVCEACAAKSHAPGTKDPSWAVTFKVS